MPRRPVEREVRGEVVRIRLTASRKARVRKRADLEDRGEVSAWLRRAIEWADETMPADWGPGDPVDLASTPLEVSGVPPAVGVPPAGARPVSPRAPVEDGGLASEAFEDAP